MGAIITDKLSIKASPSEVQSKNFPQKFALNILAFTSIRN